MRDIEGITIGDRRQAAIHEAGHLTVAHAMGCNGWTHIRPVPTNDVMSEITWTGQFSQVFWESDKPEIGVAGVVAECWVVDPDVTARSTAESIELGSYEPSDSDRRLIHGAGYEGGWPEIDEEIISIALDLLREYKTFFDWAVAELIENNVITDGYAKDHFERLQVDQRNE